MVRPLRIRGGKDVYSFNDIRYHLRTNLWNESLEWVSGGELEVRGRGRIIIIITNFAYPSV